MQFKTRCRSRRASSKKNNLARSATNKISLPKLEQLVLALQASSKVPKQKQVQPLRKRRHAEKWIAPFQFENFCNGWHDRFP
jgi:hypothetical protein